MAIKRDKLDDIFSKVIRAAYGFTCTSCGKYYPEGQRQGLHCSHIFSRRHKSTRWEPMNAVAHCYSCHQRLGGDPVEFTRWAEQFMGEGALEILREKAHSMCKRTKAEKEEMFQHYKAELKRIEALRADGVMGPIEVVGWD